MKRLLPFLCLFIFLSCQKNEESLAPVGIENCRLTDFGTGIYTGKFIYDKKGNVSKREHFADSALTGYDVFEYNTKGLLEKESLYTSEGTLKQYYTYTYDANGLLMQRQFHSMSNGKLYSTSADIFEYTSPNQLAKRTVMYNGSLVSYSTYEYDNDLMRKMLYYNKSDEHIATVELEYEDKPDPYIFVPGLQISRSGVGFPYKKNVLKRMTTYTTDPNMLQDDFTATFEYNEAGLPVKRSFAYGDGDIGVTTFAYQCK